MTQSFKTVQGKELTHILLTSPNHDRSPKGGRGRGTQGMVHGVRGHLPHPGSREHVMTQLAHIEHTPLYQHWAHTGGPTLSTHRCTNIEHTPVCQHWAHTVVPTLITHLCTNIDHTPLYQHWAVRSFTFFIKDTAFFAFFYVLYKRTQHSMHSFTFFIKERNILCVLLRSL